MSSSINSDNEPDYTETDTEIDILDSDRADEVAGEIDPGSDTDRIDVAQIASVVPFDTLDDRAPNTLPFARGKSPETVVPIRLDGGAVSSEPDRPMVGQRYLNYEIRRRLARGSMGLVYEAKHLHLGRRVAIKFLSPNLLADENMVYRFLGEAKAMAKLDHPGIPTIFDFGQDAAGNAYLIMDYLEGESLAAKLGREPLPHWRSIEIAAQTSEILAAAHVENIVHRDLKPENILLCDELRQTSSGPEPIVRLIDFGICKTRSGDQRAMTAAGNLIGTTRYMSPEQTFSESITPKTDVYALGCVIFELVAGRAPFLGKLAALIDAHRYRAPDDLRVHDSNVSRDLAELVTRMLAKDPSQRPSSGTELAAQLRRCRTRDRAVTKPPLLKKRLPLPTPRATTARADVDHGVLSAERTPLPFSATILRPPTVSGASPQATDRGLVGQDTTQLSVATARIGWGTVALVVLLFTGLAAFLSSGAL